MVVERRRSPLGKIDYRPGAINFRMESPGAVTKVLFVDDDPDFRDLAERYLGRMARLDLETVGSAEEALDRAREYDVVISDYKMPEMDGLELLRRLKSRGSPCSFILLTGKGREEVAMEALNLGADRYLMKRGGPRSLFEKTATEVDRVAEEPGEPQPAERGPHLGGMVGVVIERLDESGLARVDLSGPLGVGDEVSVHRVATNFRQRIEELRVRGEEVERGRPGDVVEIRFKSFVSEGNKVFKL